MTPSSRGHPVLLVVATAYLLIIVDIFPLQWRNVIGLLARLSVPPKYEFVIR